MYTVETHIKNLLNIIKDGEICNCCPGSLGYNVSNQPENGACDICKNFVGLTYIGYCPCIGLGEEAAYNKTIEVLKEKGYL